jgi:cell division septum initiation protein DivIVA
MKPKSVSMLKARITKCDRRTEMIWNQIREASRTPGSVHGMSFRRWERQLTELKNRKRNLEYRLKRTIKEQEDRRKARAIKAEIQAIRKASDVQKPN